MRSVIGLGCQISDDAHVADSLLMDGCFVEGGARIEHSVVGRDVIVPHGVSLRRCVVGDGATLHSGRAYQNQKIA